MKLCGVAHPLHEQECGEHQTDLDGDHQIEHDRQEEGGKSTAIS
jgi:hypothetical protein